MTPGEDVEALRLAAARCPRDPDAQILWGNALVAAGRPDEALASYAAALTLRPGHGPTLYNMGNAHLRLGAFLPAEACYRKALERDPGHAGAHNNLGHALRAQGRLAEAAEAYRRSVASRPDVAGTQANLGAALIALRRPADALGPLREAVRLEPGFAEACNTLGGALLALDRPDEALFWFDRALALDPELIQAEFGAAVTLLAMGRFAEGWARYEARWRDTLFTADEPARAAPLWDGSDPAGRRILLHSEQGLGDTLQFVRYARLLRARGAEVVLEVQAPLVRLCAEPGAGLADIVVPAGAPSPPHDARCPLMSLPRLFGTTLETVPAEVPYLWARPRLEVRRPGLNVGVALSGASDHPEDDLRSIPANAWWPVLRCAAAFHCLQPEMRAHDAAVLAALPELIRHELPDVAATAEIVAALDVVVTVDTAVAHLAGALGRKVFVLLQHSADFRWLRGREDSPWYPTARLFRRGAEEGWDPVMRRVAEALDGVALG